MGRLTAAAVTCRTLGMATLSKEAWFHREPHERQAAFSAFLSIF